MKGSLHGLHNRVKSARTFEFFSEIAGENIGNKKRENREKKRENSRKQQKCRENSGIFHKHGYREKNQDKSENSGFMVEKGGAARRCFLFIFKNGLS